MKINYSDSEDPFKSFEKFKNNSNKGIMQNIKSAKNLFIAIKNGSENLFISFKVPKICLSLSKMALKICLSHSKCQKSVYRYQKWL